MAEKGKEKVTWMKLKTTALDSEKNLMKVKKALNMLPQVRDQTFDEGTNTVTIKVVCCSPEKVMNKLCSNGRGAIKLIETIDPPKLPAQKPKEPKKPKESEKPKEPENPKPAITQAGPSSQQVIMMHPSNSASVIGQPVSCSNGNYHDRGQVNGYDERPIHDSYRGEPSLCFIM